MVREIKISKSIVIYILIILSFFSATLRMNSESALSPYRLIIPFVYLFIYLKYFKRYNKETLFLAVLFIWNLLTATMFYGKYELMLSFYVHCLCIFSIYIMLKDLKVRDGLFEKKIFHLLDYFTIFTIILFILQYIFGFQFPNTSINNESGLGTSLFYWTENELGMSLAIMIPFYLVRLFQNNKWGDLVKIILIITIMYMNDNKVAMIGVVISMVSYLLIIRIQKNKMKIFYLFRMLAYISILFLILFFWNPSISFARLEIDLNTLMFDPIIRILTLDPYKLSGSITDRADAVIYGLIELKKSYLLGIGLGNSIEMLKMSEYSLDSAKSMHNFIMQMIVELGILGLILISYIFMRVIRGVTKKNVTDIDIIRAVFFIGFIFISIQSSSGIFSNYFVWTVVMFLILCDKAPFILQNNRLVCQRRPENALNVAF